MSDKIPVIIMPNLIEAPYVFFDGSKWIVDIAKIQSYFTAIKSFGVDIVRTLPWGIWGERPHGLKSQLQPFAISGDRFDLKNYDSSYQYWRSWQTVIETLNRIGLQVRFCWLDNAGLGGPLNRFNPWCNNIQNIPDFYDARAYPMVRRFIETAIEEFRSLNVVWAWGNETSAPAMIELAREVIWGIIRQKNLSAGSMTYGADAVPGKYIGKTAEHPYPYNNGGGNVQDTLKAQIDYYNGMPNFGEAFKLDVYKEVHGCGGPDLDDNRFFGNFVNFAVESWGGNPIRKIFSDDGVFNGIDPSACDQSTYNGRTQIRPSAARWGEMVSYVLSRCRTEMGGRDKLVSFEHVPKNPSLDCQAKVFGAIANAIGSPVDPYVPAPGPGPGPGPTPAPGKKSWYEELFDYVLTEIRWILKLFGIKF